MSTISMRNRRRPRAVTGALLVAVLTVAGCSAGGGSGSAGDKAAAERGPARAAGQYGAAADSKAGGAAGNGKGAGTRRPLPTGVHIIRTAELTVRAKDVPRALDAARTAAESAGGIVGDETTDRDAQGHERSRIVLRVPQDRYQDVLDRLSGTGRLLRRTVHAKDVTDQVVDVDSRVRSARASVDRIRALMDRATKLSDVVSLEGELSSRQADLESLLAQQASLKDRTSLATITLSLTESPVKKAEKPDDEPGFVDALAGGWHAFVTMLRWLAVALGAVLPFVATAALLLALWVRFAGPRRRGAAGVAAAAVGRQRTAEPAAEESGRE
ncbi:DUF4349 domain-containing protein [Streptomyces sp. NPDC002004]